MKRLQWNGLHVGQHVLVHDEDDLGAPLIPGRVIEVESTGGSSVVTIRVSPSGAPTRIVRPRRLAVHLDSGESAERCWRCEVRYASPPPRPRARVTRAL